jgi:aminomethyltransferase
MLRTPLYDAHLRAGAKMVEFAGYEMPVQYPAGLAKEHLHTRASAGLFDVSHMGQVWVEGAGAAAFLSRLTPSNITILPLGKARYTVLLNAQGGIIDDLIISHAGEHRYFVVVNASRKEVDLAWMREHCPADVQITEWSERALLALQGPEAAAVLQSLVQGDLSAQEFMTMQETTLKTGADIIVSRLGYTGEDGFEISVPADHAASLWETLLCDPRVQPAGLGARDTLRMEMGFPLYGHDLDETTSPVEANLRWIISKNHTGYIGEFRIAKELAEGVSRLRVGVQLTERGIAREHSPVQLSDGTRIGGLSSGGMSPTLNAPMGQGYVAVQHSALDAVVQVVVRERPIAAKITALGFVPAKSKTNKK